MVTHKYRVCFLSLCISFFISSKSFTSLRLPQRFLIYSSITWYTFPTFLPSFPHGNVHRCRFLMHIFLLSLLFLSCKTWWWKKLWKLYKQLNQEIACFITLLFPLVTLALEIYRYLPLLFHILPSILYLQATAMAEYKGKEKTYDKYLCLSLWKMGEPLWWQWLCYGYTHDITKSLVGRKRFYLRSHRQRPWAKRQLL